MSSLINLTYVAVVILLGLFSVWVAKKSIISCILALLVVGIILGNVRYNGTSLINFPPLLIANMALLVLVLFFFECSARFKYKDFNDYTIKTITLFVFFLLGNIIFLTMFTHWLFTIESIFVSMMFAALMSGTSPSLVLSMIQSGKNRVLKTLGIESVINTAVIVFMPFIILDLMESIGGLDIINLINQLLPFLQQIVTGIGVGLLVGLIIFKLLRKSYFETFSPLAIIAAAIITYFLAENLSGNGVLAVTVAGLIFGNMNVKLKNSIQTFSHLFTKIFEIFVLIAVGILIIIPRDITFITKSFLLYASFLVIRIIAVTISFSVGTHTFKEKSFMTLVSPKWIAVAAVVTTLATLAIPGMTVILNLALVFLLYSVITSTVVFNYSKNFIHMEALKETI